MTAPIRLIGFSFCSYSYTLHTNRRKLICLACLGGAEDFLSVRKVFFEKVYTYEKITLIFSNTNWILKSLC